MRFKLSGICTLVASVLLFTNAGSVYALSQDQQKLFSAGILYYDKGYSACGFDSPNISATTQTKNLSDFVDVYGQAAFTIGKQYGIPYEAILAQGMIESNHGVSDLTREAYNFFGIKAGSEWTGPVYVSRTKESVNGQLIEIMASFRKYPNAVEGFRGYGLFITNNNRYSKALQYPNDYAMYLQEVAKAGYATDPNYAANNISVAKTIAQYIASKNTFPPSTQVVPDTAPPSVTNGSISDCASLGGGLTNVVTIAQQELAKNVKEYDSNVLKYTGGVEEPWCADFVSWVMAQAGMPFTGGVGQGGWRIPGVLAMQSWFQKGSSGGEYFAVGRKTPQPGDVAFFIGAQTPDQTSTQHVAIVVAVNGDKMTVIGGNQHNSVSQYPQSITVGEWGLVGFGRMKP